MNRIALCLCLCLVASAARAQPSPDAGPLESPSDAGPPPPASPRPSETAGPVSVTVRVQHEDRKCPESGWDDEDEEAGDTSVLAPLRFSVDGQARDLGHIELRGLQHLDEKQVRMLVGMPAEGAVDARRADRFLRRLVRTGLFARVEPSVRVTEGAPAVLEVTLEENPFITAVDFEGLQDIQASELMDSLFFIPPSTYSDDEDEGPTEATLRIDKERGTLSVVRPCPSPRAPGAWLAHLEEGVFKPGIVRGGLTAALERALRGLRDDGYLLASLGADLAPDGRLQVRVDEGRLEAVDVEGVDEATAERVREALGLRPGDVFLRSDARRAVRRLESRLPFLRPQDVGSEGLWAKREARFTEERAEDGTRRYRQAPEERPRKRQRERVEFEVTWSVFSEWWDDENHTEGLSLEGRRLVVHVRPRPPDLDFTLQPVHTQVTGFAPGFSSSLRIWEPRNRVNPTLDAALFVPLRLGGQHLPDDPEGTRRQRRLNLLGGAKAEVPAAGLAELGAQVHDFTDTLDRWRMGDIDSYLYSFLLNRPDREYFRRKGVAAFATFRWAEGWLTGVEYRRDRYESMQSFTPPLSLFRRDSPPFPNAPVDAGRFESVVVRLEYASEAKASTKVGSLFRTPETSLFDLDVDDERRLSARGLLTLEVGHGPGAEGADTRFWKLVSDLGLEVPTGWNSGLVVRLRAAGGNDLPEQKREALGGWSALRGYGFKEFRGDTSVLTSLEYRCHAFGLFADVGSVRGDDGWADARLGAGASLHFGDGVRFDVAWRTDEKATATPEARLFFIRTF